MLSLPLRLLIWRSYAPRRPFAMGCNPTPRYGWCSAKTDLSERLDRKNLRRTTEEAARSRPKQALIREPADRPRTRRRPTAANERRAAYFFLNKSSGFNLGAVFVAGWLVVAGC